MYSVTFRASTKKDYKKRYCQKLKDKSKWNKYSNNIRQERRNKEMKHRGNRHLIIK